MFALEPRTDVLPVLIELCVAETRELKSVSAKTASYDLSSRLRRATQMFDARIVRLSATHSLRVS